MVCINLNHSESLDESLKDTSLEKMVNYLDFFDLV